MTKGEWMRERQIYISIQKPGEEATPEWIRAIESLIEALDEMHEGKSE